MSLEYLKREHVTSPLNGIKDIFNYSGRIFFKEVEGGLKG